MSAEPPVGKAPPLAELFELLRAEGFAIGVDDHVRVATLIAHDAAWTIARLRAVVRAIVVKDRREQAAFDRCWERWLPPPAVELKASPVVMPRRRRRWPWIAAAIVTIAAVIALLAGRDTRGRVAGGGSGSGSGSDVDLIPKGAKIDLGDQPLQARDAYGEAEESPLAGIDVPVAIAGGAIVLACGLVALGALRRRRRFVPGPWVFELGVPARSQPVLSRIAIEDAAGDLATKSTNRGDQLDVRATVVATVEAGGVPTFRYHHDTSALRYAVLEDQVGIERWRFLYDELFRGLARDGVVLERYTFVASLDSCAALDGTPVDLRDLLEHADALIVVGDGAAAIDPLSGNVAEWVGMLRQVPRRLWINPVPPSRWSAGARVIELDTMMEHGVAAAIARLRATADAPEPPSKPYPAILDRAPDSPSAVRALFHYLGASAFRVVAATAVLERPSLEGALWLAEQLGLAPDEQAWLHVSTLPWLETRTWPAGLRDRLQAALAKEAPAVLTGARRALERALASSEPPRGSTAHIEWEIEVAAHAARAGDRRRAARSLSRLASTPSASHARGQLRALGLPNVRRIYFGLAMVLGVAFLGAGATSLVWSSLHAAPPPRPLSEMAGTLATADGDIQILLAPRARAGEPPEMRVTVIGGPTLGADKFKLIDEVRHVQTATKIEGYDEGGETLALAIVMGGQEIWIGNDDIVPEDGADLYPIGGLKPLKAALQRVPLTTAGPPGSKGLLVVYADTAEVVVPWSPLSQLTSEAFGKQTNYYKRSGSALVPGVERALAELHGQKAARKALLVIGDGNDDQREAAAQQLPALKQQAATDQISTFACIFKGQLSDARNDITTMIPNAKPVNSADDIANFLRAFLARLADRYYLTFPAANADGQPYVPWDGKAHGFVVEIAGERTGIMQAVLPVWQPAATRSSWWIFALGGGVLLAGIAWVVLRR